MSNPVSNPWKIVKTKDIYETPWIEVVKHDVLNPSGNPGKYSVVKLVKKGSSAMINADKNENITND